MNEYVDIVVEQEPNIVEVVTQEKPAYIEVVNDATEAYIDVIVEKGPEYVDVVVEKTDLYVDVIVENVVQRIVDSYPYIKVLSGFNVVITQNEHRLDFIRGMTILNPNGDVVEVAENISGTTVTIDSNILLDNHILKLF